MKKIKEGYYYRNSNGAKILIEYYDYKINLFVGSDGMNYLSDGKQLKVLETMPDGPRLVRRIGRSKKTKEQMREECDKAWDETWTRALRVLEGWHKSATKKE